jgi:energy-coupling factor transporter ATP-binding protein EcfA2
VSGRQFLNIGKDSETGKKLYIEADRSRAIFICGKRGSGKSYTLGVLIEELFENAKGEALIVVCDPMGIYHTMVLPNERQIQELYSWGLAKRGFPVRLLIPRDPVAQFGSTEIVERIKARGVELKRLRINAGSLTPDEWCYLLGLNLNDLMGIALYRAVDDLQEQSRFFPFGELERTILKDRKSNDRTKQALANRLSGVKRWDVFQEAGEEEPIQNMFTTDAINIIDLADLTPGPYSIRNLIMSVIGQQLFAMRIKERRKEEFGMHAHLPKVWLAIDEAHEFVPVSGSLSKDLLVRWVKEGRQPGLSLIAATQQPAAVDSEVLSQCDVIISHKITSIEDINALNRLSATYMSGELRTLIRNLGRRGEAILVDDETEEVNHLMVRPRLSAHGGGETGEDEIRKSLFEGWS